MQAVLSMMLGFLSWSFWLTTLIAIAMIYVGAHLLRRRGHAGGWALAVALIAVPVLATAMPFANQAYLMSFGSQRPATIEKLTTFTEFNLGRRTRSTQNERLDLLVTDDSGQVWRTSLNRRAGMLGPYALPELRLASGDDVVVAMIDGVPSNVTIVTDASPARWQARLRQIDAAWEINPPQSDWVSHNVHRRMIEDFLAEHRDDIGSDSVARLEARLDDLTEKPPEGLSPVLHDP
ncbi:hypothetical protein NOF55_23190 [Rhizobiaceae bacterium BDR2-2]|uniref:Uncharacterized protein n=1 Tax=Ectorhizobium quercum TaxID=2965071 RepID=A0AAE3N3N7_9HYPH|nr:hypothetical protein [Ectorhizobium quercum]MCX9000009.1 hypothetical protein [Ectorhizobium quercum]